MPNLGQIQQLRSWLASSVTRAFSAALAVPEPAGTSEDWLQVCAQFQVLPSSDQERQEIRRAQLPICGAPVTEFHAVSLAICRSAQWGLGRIDRNLDSPEADTARDRLGCLIERTAQEVTAAYRRAVLPAAPVGMFANVLAHHSVEKPVRRQPDAHVLQCRHCGAPRLRNTDFTCAYCSQHMAQ